MNRDEFLATSVMGWVFYEGFYTNWWIHPILVPSEEDSGELTLRYPSSKHGCETCRWSPGESWPQTGMILEEMREGFRVSVRQHSDNQSYIVAFREWGHDYGGAYTEGLGLREAIATAAAKAKGWTDGIG